jgi:hypothetical protein
VRLAWALSWRRKSSRNQAIESEVNGNCTRATERGKEAGNVSSGPMNKKRIGGNPERGERAEDCSFWVAAGGVVKRRVSANALGMLKDRVRAITRRTGGRSIEQVVDELGVYSTGWKQYGIVKK